MADIDIKRGYEVLPDNRVRFGIRLNNKGDTAISEVKVILDYSHSLFELEGNKIEEIMIIPPSTLRTVKFILKPLGCVHQEKIGATVSYRDHKWEKHILDMHPKEVNCIYPFLKEKLITLSDFLKLASEGYSVEYGVNFEKISIEELIELLFKTCKNRLYRVYETPIENGKVLYLAGDSLGEKAYYLLTAVVIRREDIVQVLLHVSSDKSLGTHGFLNEILENLRHLVRRVHSAREIGTIKNEQVINIINSVVQGTYFSGEMEASSVNIQGSLIQSTNLGSFIDNIEEETEERLYSQQDAIGELPKELDKQEELHKQREKEINKKEEKEKEKLRNKEEKAEKLVESKKSNEGSDRRINEKKKDPLEKKLLIFSLLMVAVLIFTMAVSMASNRTGDLASNRNVSEQLTPPVANFSADTTLGNAPMRVQFTDISNMSNNGTEYNWNLGDGFITKAQNPEYTYTNAGNYTVELTVSNAAGNDTETKKSYITVAPPLPALLTDFSADTTLGNAPLRVKFTDNSAGSPTEWKWNFGDGNTSSTKNPTHTYSAVGTYTVKETVYRKTISGKIEDKSERKTDYIIVM